MTPSIDKDIMDDADDVWGILPAKCLPSRTPAECVTIIATALQAVRNEERERCAKETWDFVYGECRGNTTADALSEFIETKIKAGAA